MGGGVGPFCMLPLLPQDTLGSLNRRIFEHRKKNPGFSQVLDPSSLTAKALYLQKLEVCVLYPSQ